MYWEPCQTSKIELFAKVVNGIQPLTIFPKSYILDVIQRVGETGEWWAMAPHFWATCTFSFGKEWTLKTLQNICINEASDCECVPSKHQCTNSFQAKLSLKSENILTTNRLIAISNEMLNHWDQKDIIFEFTKGWFQSKVLRNVRSDNGFYTH